MTLISTDGVRAFVRCDRCHKTVDGIEDGMFTGGFYRRHGHDVVPGTWDELFTLNEEEVCDDCMQSDPRYLSMYPANLPHSTPEQQVSSYPCA